MNDVIFLGIIFALMTRCAGFVVSLEFFFKLKDRKFLKLVFGWFFWILSGLTNMYSLFISNPSISEVLILFNSIFSSLGDVFILIGIMSYFREIPNKFFIFLILFFILGALLTFYTSFYLFFIGISSIGRFCITIAFTALPFIERKHFSKIITKKSYIWFVSLAISIYFYTIVFFSLIFQGKIHGGIINTTGMELIVYLLLLNSITFMLVILIIHLEYDLSNSIKFEMKDRYSHDLGNKLQVITGTIDLLALKMQEDKNIKDKLSDIDTIKLKCKESADIIKEIRKL
ncbi:MAG: hypothetical protein EU533_05235 [Promethearchaeota archaeon]|nr:MAG: hypothetical protein EU533_05235 [Candidatus Lokiarchaeota archaeon]